MTNPLSPLIDGAVRGAKTGLREGLVLFWYPLRPRIWRFVARQVCVRGLVAGIRALLLDGPDLLLEGRLNPDGTVRPLPENDDTA